MTFKGATDIKEPFHFMTLAEKLAHIKKCQDEGLEEIRKGSPSNLADIADHLDLWGPWMLNKLNRMNKQVTVMRDALEVSVHGLWGEHGTCVITPAHGRKLELCKQALASCEELEKPE